MGHLKTLTECTKNATIGFASAYVPFLRAIQAIIDRVR